jgi:hypothetical protein
VFIQYDHPFFRGEAVSRRALGSVAVTTPDIPQQPKGQFWDELKKAKTREQIQEVRKRARRFGYSPDGQLMQAIADRLSQLDAEV